MRQTFSALKQPIVYALIGIVNTALTATIIFGLMAMDVSPVASNAAGYGAGLLASFTLNSRLTFQVRANKGMLIRFLIVSGIAYLANLITVLAVLKWLELKQIAQIAGMPVYTIVGYLANKYWAMAR